MNAVKFSAISVLVVGLSFSLQSFSEWRSQMQKLKTMMEDLAPTIYSDTIEGPRQKEYVTKLRNIESEIGKLNKDLGGHMKVASDQDPTQAYLLKAFRRHVGRAVESAELGNYLYSRDLYRSSSAFCVACHSRNAEGVQFPIHSLVSQKMKSANWLDRMIWQTSTRQFDDALQEFRERVGGPKVVSSDRSRSVENRPADIEKSSRLAMVIALRAKRDPVLAKELVAVMKKSSSPSMTTKKVAAAWDEDLKTLAPLFKDDGADALSLMSAARKLIGDFADREIVQGYPEADVKLIAVSQLMHNLFLKPATKDLKAEAYYYLGIVNEALSYLGLWSLHEIYYEACIEESPKSAVAQKCFLRYRSSLSFEFAGSFSERLLPSVRSQIKRFEAMVEQPK